MTTPTPIAPITAQSLLRELIPVSEQQRKAIDTACDALDALERDLAAAQEARDQAIAIARELAKVATCMDNPAPGSIGTQVAKLDALEARVAV